MLIIAHTKLILKYSRIKMKELWEYVRFNGWILIASKWYRLYNKQVIVPNSMDQNKLSSYSMELIKMIIQQTCIQIFHTRHLKANKMSVFHIDAWAWLARNIEIIELRAREQFYHVLILGEQISGCSWTLWAIYLWHGIWQPPYFSCNYSDANNVTHENLICFCYWTERVVNTKCANRL